MIKSLFKQACLDELQAIKPGNVHVFADGHGMTLEDFIQSAEAASDAMAHSGYQLGERILSAVEATHNVVHCNTNLGIILLCAPLVQSVIQAQSIDTILANTTLADSILCFRAIALANPGGLGESDSHDVRKLPDCTLLQAMRAAAERDLVARQYENNFSEVYKVGVPHFSYALTRWDNASWATPVVSAPKAQVAGNCRYP